MNSWFLRDREDHTLTSVTTIIFTKATYMVLPCFLWVHERVAQLPPELTKPSWPHFSTPDFDAICWAERSVTKPEWRPIKTNREEMPGCAQQSSFPCLNRWFGKQCLVDLVRTNYTQGTLLHNERACMQLSLCVYRAYANPAGKGATQAQPEHGRESRQQRPTLGQR